MGRAGRPDTAPTAVGKLEPSASRAAANRGELTDPSPQFGALSDAQLARIESRFYVKKLLGTGGMGVVVQVEDRILSRDVALKLLFDTTGDESRTRFLREARAAGVLRHPNIVTVHDVDPNAGFIVMELVTGGSLSDRLDREPKLPIQEVHRIARALLSALGAAHDAGIVHRDVKPGNILFDATGTVKLTDFGVASFGDSELTTTGTRIGTPDYMAPEQLRGRQCDVRADIYATGATLFEAATGHKLHDDERTRAPAQLVREATNDEVLARAIEKAVQEHAADRFQSAGEMLAALDTTRRRTRRLVPIAVIGALALAGITLGGVMLVRDSAPPHASAGVDELLARGIRATEDNDLETASKTLTEVVTREPNRAEAYQYLSLVLEWQGKPVGEITAAIEKGLAGSGLEPARRTFLEGFKLLVARRHREALVYFNKAIESYPHDRYVRYGLFEALFHSGDPAASIAQYRKLCEQAPSFRLGIYHPLAYYIVRDDRAGVDWAVRQSDAPSLREWRPRSMIGRRDYASAIADLRHTIASGKDLPPTFGKLWLSQALAVSGQLDEAVRTAEEVAAKDVTSAGLALWSLGLARGLNVQRWRDVALRAPAAEPIGITRIEAWLQLGTIAVVVEPDRLRSIGDGIETAMRDEPGEIIQADVGLALVGGSLRDAALVERARMHGYAEAIAITDAFAAEARAAVPEAIAAWKRAVEASADGRYLIVENYFLARAAVKTGDRELVASACREVIAPRVFSWSWGATVRDCQAWTAAP